MNLLRGGKTNYTDIILSLVNSYTVLKGQDLGLAVMERVNPQSFDNERYLNALEGLVESGEIKEVIYTTALTTRVLYFPKGTSFQIGKKG